jgi:hypothetical protein
MFSSRGTVRYEERGQEYRDVEKVGKYCSILYALNNMRFLVADYSPSYSYNMSQLSTPNVERVSSSHCPSIYIYNYIYIYIYIYVCIFRFFLIECLYEPCGKRVAVKWTVGSS